MVTQRSSVVNNKTFDSQTPFKALRVTLQTEEIKYIKATRINVREHVQTDVFIKYSLDIWGVLETGSRDMSPMVDVWTRRVERREDGGRVWRR